MNTETKLVLLAGMFCYLLLLAIRSLLIIRDDKTSFEINRRAKTGDKAAQQAQIRSHAISDILTAKHIIETILIVIIVICTVRVFGFLFGVIISTALLIFIEALARPKFINRFVQKYYDKNERTIVRYVQKIHPFLHFIRSNINQQTSDFKLNSREELIHIVNNSPDIFTPNERSLIEHNILFEDKIVRDIMTPRSVVESVEATDTLGPVVLDRLHKTGHSRFPVIEKDLDHTIGVLYAHELVKYARSAKEVSARDAMDNKIFYINETQNLPSALAGFLKNKHHIFIVVNEFEETVGIITLEDVIESLIGRKIIDEFDKYDDLRTVAKNTANSRNNGKGAKHIANQEGDK